MVDLFSRNVIRQSLVRTAHPWRDACSAGLCRPRFSFFNIQFSKNRHRKRSVVGQSAFALLARSSVAHAALLISINKGELFRRQRRAALVGERYIVGGAPKCQHRFRSFLNFLRQSALIPLRPSVRRPNWFVDVAIHRRKGALLPPQCGTIPRSPVCRREFRAIVGRI